MLKQQKRRSQQITNTKKPIRPIQLTISKRNSNMNLLTQSSTYGYENVLSINNNKHNNNKKGINISSSGSCYNQQKQKQKQNSNVKNVAQPMILSLGARIRKPLMEGSLNVMMMGRVNQNQNNKNFKKQYNNRNSQGRQQQYSHPIQQNNQNHHFTNTQMTQSVHIQPSIPSSMMMSTNIQNVNSKQNMNIHVDEEQKSYSLVTKTIRPNKMIQSVKYQCVSQKQQLQQLQQQSQKERQKYDHISVDGLLIMGSKLQQLLKKVSVVGNHHHHNNNNDKQTNKLKQQNDLVQDTIEREMTNQKVDNNNVQDNLSGQQQRQQPTKTVIQANTNTTINISNNIEYYKDFQQRLQLCLQQLNQLQSLNNTQRILQLQQQIATLKQAHHQQQSKLINKVKQLQCQLQKYQYQKQTNIKQQQQKLQQQQLRQQQFSKLLTNHHTTQLNCLQICNQSNNRQSSSIATTQSQSHYSTINTTRRQTTITYNQEQSFYYELEILRRKYTTLQQLLQTKRSQILNKDHIIKLLLKEKVQNVINNNNNNNNSNIIIDSIVDQMFSLMQSKLCIQ